MKNTRRKVALSEHLNFVEAFLGGNQPLGTFHEKDDVSSCSVRYRAVLYRRPSGTIRLQLNERHSNLLRSAACLSSRQELSTNQIVSGGLLETVSRL